MAPSPTPPGAPPVPLLVATFNPGKAGEIARILGTAGFAVVSLTDPAVRGMHGIDEPFDETGATYEENAAGKARHYARLAGRIAVADDSGIEVEALGGRPGVLSARYGGPGIDDPTRNRLLLEELRGVPEERRGARYVSVAAVARPDGAVRLVHGICPGRVTTEPRGRNGFGYDPVFFCFALDATFAEVDEERKNRASHRGQAFARLAAFLAGAEGRRFLAGEGR
jgi:XTP/dITP diphosphohydrolase